ncbi:hypothetical protein [Gloeobacter violaceus]|uniref:Gll4220 protein n=1 Tax=Gloeobacter violaceus (strain ATCC 29082 / PCC 7421) TaxID=251221 RepID=Q7NDL5_GLOVI|nr:hypothetical protein [Gloeobacter violaceus]BAC92161.1 gll4220 [Gloeobacter violaceus PCC 7421]
MITNRQQYENTLYWISQFEKALEELPEKAAHSGLLRPAVEAQAGAYRCQIEDLRRQMQEYDRLQRAPGFALESPSLGELPHRRLKPTRRRTTSVSRVPHRQRIGRHTVYYIRLLCRYRPERSS